LFTDIEGSTRLLQHVGDDGYARLLREHHRILRETIAAHQGVEVSTEGDAFLVVFPDARDAVAMALSAQLALSSTRWPAGSQVRVRMGMHTGRAQLGGDNYVGLALHQAARVASAAHGGQVVASDATVHAALALPDGASWRSLGRHRLKDLGAAVELHQLYHGGLEANFAPLRSLERVAHNLPIQASSFLGRVDELGRGAELLATTRLLTLSGPGGIGKTRVAYQLAADQLNEFCDGVWVTELAAVRDPAMVEGTLIGVLGLRDEPGQSATETLVEYLRARRALVVLDNCEHVVDAAARLAAALVGGCEHVVVLATSREPLRVTGETVWSLGPLESPERGDLAVEVLEELDAVRLFCERAAEAKVDFELSADNAEAVASICKRLEGMPLAIELAAAWVRSLSPAQIGSRLGRSLELLAKGARGADSRQSSLRATIAWSTDLFSETEAILFSRLSVFVGGWDLEAAEDVCAEGAIDASQVVGLLDALVDKSMVAVSDHLSGQTRSRFLETIGAYAAEQLERSGQAEVFADRHAAFYSRLARDVAAEPVSGQGLDRLEVEHANLLGALDHLYRSGTPVDHGWLLQNLQRLWAVRGHWQLARRELLRYLARATRDRRLEGRCIGCLGNVALELFDYPEAQGRYEEAIRIARELGDRQSEGAWVGGLGNVALELGGYPEARARYEEALGVARELGDRQSEGAWVGGLGNVARELGDYPEARARYEEALGVARELGDRRSECYWVGSLGEVFSRLSDYQGARARYGEALPIARELGDRRYEGMSVGSLGDVAMHLRDYPQARARFEEALGIARELGNRRLEGGCVHGLGDVAMHLADYADATARYEEALGIARELGNRRLECGCVIGLGDVAMHRADYAEATARYEEALGIARELRDRRNEGMCLGSLGNVASDLGDYRTARAHYLAALSIARELGTGDVGILEECADLLARVERGEVAAQLLASAADLRGRAHKARSAREQERYDATFAICRAMLTEEAFASASAHGSELDWGSAAEIALEALSQSAG